MTPDEEAYWDDMFQMADSERDAQHWCCNEGWREGHLADCVRCRVSEYTQIATLNAEFTIADKAWLDNFGIIVE